LFKNFKPLSRSAGWEGGEQQNKPEDLPVASNNISELSGEKPG
jgi:hypothetical protein